MSAFELYKEIENVSKVGQAHKVESDMIENATWWNAIESRVGYFYDYYHDLKSDEALKLRDLHPENDKYKVPIDIKYFRHTSQTLDKDQTSFHLRFRPGQKCTVSYFDEEYGDKYQSLFPVGLYCDIPDANGIYNKWMVVAPANFYDMQFPSFEILPCDRIFQWIFEGKKYQMVGVGRSQNSYNVGEWTAYHFTSVENQRKATLPLNVTSQNIFYNQRMILDNMGVETEPVVWKVAKVERSSPNGIIGLTYAQDLFDEHKDYIERDVNGKIIGMWADYFKDGISATSSEDFPKITKYVKMSYKGTQNFQLKVGGSARTFLVQYYDEHDNPTDYDSGSWSVMIDNKNADKFISIAPVKDGEVKVKVIGDDSLIGKECIITFKSMTGSKDSIKMNISGL